jgi:phosphatidylglycerol:prolipoprotein diacylglycerol transferase
MIAAIPYFMLPVWSPVIPGIGVVPIDPWATLVCMGFVLGLELARNRAIKLGLDVRDIIDGAVFIVLMGFLFGHLFTVVAYYPERLQKDGVMALLRVWEGFSSFGGFIGATIGAALFYGLIRPRSFWRHGDVISYGFPLGWLFGRLGCGVVHDHIGKLTTFPLAMDFDHGWAYSDKLGWVGNVDPYPGVEGVRHELGLDEAALMVVFTAAFLWLGRKDRPPGFFTGVFAVGYAPIRFGMEFLRNTDLSHQDARYLGLTPAQYGCIVMLAGGAALLATRDWKGFIPWPMDGGPDQERRAIAARDGATTLAPEPSPEASPESSGSSDHGSPTDTAPGAS